MPVGTAALIGGGIGLAGGIAKAASDADKAKRQRALAAETQRYSPWTHLQANPVEEANVAGDIIGGAGQGGAMGQNLSSAIPVSGAPTPVEGDTTAALAPGAPKLGVNTQFAKPSFPDYSK